MKILEKEIALRDETRTLDQARPALAAENYGEKVEPLAETQASLGERVHEVIEKIRALPEGEAMFAKEIGLLSAVKGVMGEAHQLLARPDTGPETIAAETEAIELLMQTRRINPKGGGGGGGTTPGGGGGGDTELSALALLGTGVDPHAKTEERTVGQATGSTGSSLPAEFRAGLDAYFGKLEASAAGGAE